MFNFGLKPLIMWYQNLFSNYFWTVLYNTINLIGIEKELNCIAYNCRFFIYRVSIVLRIAPYFQLIDGNDNRSQ